MTEAVKKRKEFTIDKGFLKNSLLTSSALAVTFLGAAAALKGYLGEPGSYGFFQISPLAAIGLEMAVLPGILLAAESHIGKKQRNLRERHPAIFARMEDKQISGAEFLFAAQREEIVAYTRHEKLNILSTALYSVALATWGLGMLHLFPYREQEQRRIQREFSKTMVPAKSIQNALPVRRSASIATSNSNNRWASYMLPETSGDRPKVTRAAALRPTL